MSTDPDVSETIRAYQAFKYGARLRSEDVQRLLARRGHRISDSAMREIGRDRGRGTAMTPRLLADLLSAWADEMRPDKQAR